MSPTSFQTAPPRDVIIIAIVVMVPDEGFEPSRTLRPRDFKSRVSTIPPARLVIYGAEEENRTPTTLKLVTRSLVLRVYQFRHPRTSIMRHDGE